MSETKATGGADSAPYIPATTSLPEITLKAVVLGFVLAMILAGANAYLGLKVGMTVSASIPAAVISMAVLRLFRESNILENNIVQTAASAAESLAAGVIFTLPALILLQYWNGFPFGATMGIALFGGILGVLFTIPLRRALIIEAGLQFPEGVATGEVLKAGTTGGKGIRAMAAAAVAAAMFKLTQTGLKIAAPSAGGAVSAGGAIFGIGIDLGVALLAVGYIVGLNIATLVFAGGAISWLIAIPIYSIVADPAVLAEITAGTTTTFGAANAIWSAQIRYLGVGAMAVGGIWALVSLIKPIRDGIQSSLQAVRQSRQQGTSDVPRTERDTPITVVMIGTVALTLPLLLVFMYVIDQDALVIGQGLYISTIGIALIFSLIAGFLFSSVAGYMAGLVGSSNNPISGVTIATILTISLILLVLLGTQIDFAVGGAAATSAAATAILVGAVVCCAAAIAGDNMQDLKSGRIVGATPYKQQIMQMVGVLAGAIVIAPVLDLLFNAYGLGGVFPREGMDPAEMLSAPQATLMASVAEGVFHRNLPWAMIIIGGLIAVVIIVYDKFLDARKSSFRAPVLAVAVGIYLPIDLSVPIFIGGIVAHYAVSRFTRRSAEFGADTNELAQRGQRRGLLFASGLITGEALVGIVLAVPFALAESTDVLRLPLEALGLGPDGMATLTTVLGLGAFAAFTLWMYRVAAKVYRGADI